ncbi:MAG: hypothetical protein LBQ01_04555 [Prevotellaceae bacterium]|jgi:hypothetical protein|nr:hypothetical protein [Prevotellaceae bacterium]
MNKISDRKRKQNVVPVKAAAEVKGITFPFIFLNVLFIAIHLFLSLNPAVERGWGLNCIRFFDGITVFLFYCVTAMVCLPPVNRMIVGFFVSVTQAKIMHTARRYKMILFILIAVGAGFIFRAMQIKYLFLGDVGIRPTDVEEGKIIANEFLTMIVLSKLYTWLHSIWNFSGLQTIQLVSYISGGFFILFSLLTADAVGKSLKKKIACFVLSTLSLTALVQFCGYSDIYPIALSLLQLYLYLSILCLQKKVSIVFPAITIIAGIAFHYMLAYMLPSLVYMFYRNVLYKYPFFRKKNTLAVLAAIACIAAYYVYVRIARPLMLPMDAGEKNMMTMFSTAHYKEFINAQLLGGGFMFIVWIAVSLFYIFNKTVKFTVTHWFLSIASCSATGFLFVADLWRGSGDWDIYSSGAIVFNLAATVLLLDLHEQKALKNIRYGVCTMAVFAVMHTSFWAVTNATDKSIGWIEKALEKDPASYYKRSFSNESMLGALFSSNNLRDKSLYWERKAYLTHQNDPRAGYNYANALIGAGIIDEAVRIYESSVTRFPSYALPYAQLVSIYSSNNDSEALYRLLLKIEEVYKKNPEVFTSRLSQQQIESYFNLLEQFRASEQ